jgi:glutaredoxin 3
MAAEYHDVKKDKARLEEMLKQTGGKRDVPVIIQDGKVSIGYGGS